MLRIKNFDTGKILQNIYGHFINYVTKREEFVNFDNLPESRPRQDVGTGPQGSGYMTKGWIRWNEAPSSATAPIGWVVYDRDSETTALNWVPFYGESSGSFSLSAEEIDSGEIFYSIIGKQVLISGYIQFNTFDTDVEFSFPKYRNKYSS